MAEIQNFFSFFTTQIRSGWLLLFSEKRWNPLICGVFLAVLSLFMFMWWFVWGIAGGYKLWGDWLYYLLGIYNTKPKVAPWFHGYTLSNIGILLGAFCASLFSGEFRINPAPSWEYVKGFFGGILMGIGAGFSMGCNVGGFYSAIAMLDLGGICMMFGLFIGAYLGLKYLLWEIEHIKVESVCTTDLRPISSKKIYFFIGMFVFLLTIFVFWFYSKIDKTQMGGVLFLGFLIGMIMQRGRFCFANSFREPFMTGDSTMIKSVLLSLVIYTSGVVIIKWSYIQPPKAWIFHPYLGSFIGGIIFGFGMLLAGGCASGILWRMGEGHLKLFFAFFGFLFSHSLTHKALKIWNIKTLLGKGIFLPNILGWPISFVLLLMLFLVLYVVFMWNEETDKFVAC